MRVTFPRLPDHERAYALVERDDAVVYRLYGGTAGPRLPHDIVHLVVERELAIRDGIWGGIAAGAVFDTMRYAGGRRPPHAAERSRWLRRGFGAPGLRAELLADLVSSAAALDHMSVAAIRRLAEVKLAVLPDVNVDPVAIAAAAQALQVEAARWARLRVGEQLSYNWPRQIRAAPSQIRAAPGQTPAAPSRTPAGRGQAPDLPRIPSPRVPPGPVRDNGLYSRRQAREHRRMDARPDEVIKSGEITLRRYRPDDVDALLKTVAESRDHLRPWMSWAADHDREAAGKFLAQTVTDWDTGAAFNYAIITEGVLAGGCGLMARIGPGGLEIGYWVHGARTRRGLATTAAAALVEQAFGLPGVNRVEIVHDELNVASGGIPRKLGFAQAGRRPIEPPSPEGTGTGVVWRLVR